MIDLVVSARNSVVWFGAAGIEKEIISVVGDSNIDSAASLNLIKLDFSSSARSCYYTICNFVILLLSVHSPDNT